MKKVMFDCLKETLTAIMIIFISLVALFGGQVIRLHQAPSEPAAPAGISQSVDKPIEGITRTVVLEPVTVDNVQAAAEPGITVPEYIVEITERVGQAYSISPELLQAIAWRESRFQTDAVNASGTCFGLMQISKKWHSRRLAKGEDILDPEANIRIAAEYLAELFERYKEPALVLMIYNGDSRAFKEGYISRYATDVMGLAEELEKIGE